MIVCCPLCGTRYRHSAPRGGRPRQARCSTCEEVFPLRAGVRTYLLSGPLPEGGGAAALPRATPLPGIPVLHASATAAGAGRTGFSIGMDDPALAPHLDRTTLNQDSGAAWPALTYRLEAADDSSFGEGPAAAAEPPAPQVAMLDEREERRSRAAWAGRLLVGTGIGAAAGGVVAHWVGLDPDYGLVAGAVAGVAVAIAGRRWKLRRP